MSLMCARKQQWPQPPDSWHGSSMLAFRLDCADEASAVLEQWGLVARQVATRDT